MLQLSSWPYIRQISLTGVIKADITNFLAENGKQETAEHCIAVANICESLADRFELDKTIASYSALLHDISNVLKPPDMLDYAISCGWIIDDSERNHPCLLHQRVSAVFAKDIFDFDNEIMLSAIECHTTLKKNPTNYDMLLFIADKLSWDQNGTPPFYTDVSSALNHSLAHASLAYINFVLNNGMILSPHQWLIEAKSWLEKFV